MLLLHKLNLCSTWNLREETNDKFIDNAYIYYSAIFYIHILFITSKGVYHKEKKEKNQKQTEL